MWAEMRVQKQEVPTEPYSKARVVLTRLSSRQADYDNVVASFKVVVDALVKNSILADDGPDNFVNGHPDYQWEKGKSGVRIEIWPV